MTTAYDVDPCPECGETKKLSWQDSTPTTDTWACGECGCTFVITVEPPPVQKETEPVERTEIDG